MLYYTMAAALSRPKSRKRGFFAKGDVYAPETLVDARAPTAARVRAAENLPVDGRLPGGNDDSHRAYGGDQYRPRFGADADLL